MFKIYPYKMSSTSAKYLAQGLDCKRIRQEGTYVPRRTHKIINWGNSHIPPWMSRISSENILNSPAYTQIASNKLHTFQHLTDYNISLPDWTQRIETATQWINDGYMVYCRKSLTGNSGQGIVLAQTRNELVPAPLYTKYTKCKHEFRVHVMNGEVIDYVQKKKRNALTAEEEQLFNPFIKSHSYGWIFAREEISLPSPVIDVALASIRALNLDFGAVDIGFKVNENKAFVYEVNTAPGLTGTTLDKYIHSFKEKYYGN